MMGKERNMVPTLMSITSWDMGMNKLRKYLPVSLSDEDTGAKDSASFRQGSWRTALR